MPLFNEMITRALASHPEMNQHEEAPTFDLGLPSVPDSSSMHPLAAALMGAGVDGASTYGFLSKSQPKGPSVPLPMVTGSSKYTGGRVEDNKLYQGLHNDPLKTGLAAAGTGLGSYMLSKLVAKKWPKVADMIQGQMGAMQLGTGLNNVEGDSRGGTPAIFQDTTQAIQRKP